MLNYTPVESDCVGCGDCANAFPVHATSLTDGCATVTQRRKKCGYRPAICPVKVITLRVAHNVDLLDGLVMQIKRRTDIGIASRGAMLDCILFDLDETLYSRESGLLKQVGRRIQAWVSNYMNLTWEEAHKVRRDYYVRYGTTLEGLVAEHNIDADDYLTFVHDIPIEAYLKPNPELAAMLSALPLRRAIYTNATTEYSWRVLRALGVSDCFERVISIEDVGLRNKLYRDAYKRALVLVDAEGPACVMVEDTARNLRAAKELGLTTVLVWTNGASAEAATTEEGIDFFIEDVLDVGRVVRELLGPTLTTDPVVAGDDESSIKHQMP